MSKQFKGHNTQLRWDLHKRQLDIQLKQKSNQAQRLLKHEMGHQENNKTNEKNILPRNIIETFELFNCR